MSAALARFADLLDGGEEFALHASEARAAVEELLALLAGAREIEWSGLQVAR